MAGVDKLFTDLQQKKAKYVAGSEGKHFEEKIESKLCDLGYSKLSKDDDLESLGIDLKAVIKQAKQTDRDKLLRNDTRCDRRFMCQPAGTQGYPDFMLFDEKTIICIETKFRKGEGSKPMWNSGLPRPNGIYIFGSYGKKDITFFLGKDVISVAEVKKMHDFFSAIKKKQEQFNAKEMAAQPYGFTAYNRKAFDQQTKHNRPAIVNYFTNPQREDLEQRVIDYVKHNDGAV